MEADLSKRVDESERTSEDFQTDRRAALALGVAGLAMLSSRSAAAAAQGPAPEHKKVQLRSPRDGTVKNLAAAGHVGLGDIVIEIDSTQEQEAINKLMLAQALVDDQQNLLSGSPLDAQRVPLTQDQIIANGYSSFATSLWQEDVALVNYAILHRDKYPDDEFRPLRQAAERSAAVAARAQAEVAKCKAALELFDYKVTATKAQLKRTKDALASQIGSLQSQQDGLKLRAPAQGNFVPHCYVGGYVKRGEIVAEII